MVELVESVEDDGLRPLGKRDRKKADKNRRILLAARELFESQGFDRTTTAEISRLAGVATGTLYLYASSKEQLLFDVFAHDMTTVWTLAFDAVDEGAPVVEQVISVFHTVSAYHGRHRGIAATYFLQLGQLRSRSDGGIDETMELIFSGLEELISRLQNEGKLDDSVEASALVHNLYAIWTFVMVNRFVNSTKTDAEARHALRRSMTTALTGLVR